MALQPWRTGIVTRIEQATHNTRRYWVKVPELERFDFTPGQFVTLDLPIHEKPNRRWRSYSIASWPDGSNEFELLIVLLEGGAGTQYLFHEVQVGTELQLRGPQGVFVLPQDLQKDLYLICTGTGIAPFRSMLHHIERHNIAHQGLHLIFGTRSQSDLLYYDELRALEERLPGFRYLPTLSREQWQGCCGYVHNVYEDLVHTHQAAEGSLPHAQFFLCGWKAMVDEAKERILKLGFEKKDVVLELYG
ncbi:FAD-dependent oxidoreductase [Flaviaesturariibacter amylovorans]|uniref:FAD-binding oxidoreductase n=1 Tax=Flaviaesturariibacter amylovorans TaxID=1084520 RepID=A0ABP8GDK4_9BACT